MTLPPAADRKALKGCPICGFPPNEIDLTGEMPPFEIACDRPNYRRGFHLVCVSGRTPRTTRRRWNRRVKEKL